MRLTRKRTGRAGAVGYQLRDRHHHSRADRGPHRSVGSGDRARRGGFRRSRGPRTQGRAAARGRTPTRRVHRPRRGQTPGVAAEELSGHGTGPQAAWAHGRPTHAPLGVCGTARDRQDHHCPGGRQDLLRPWLVEAGEHPRGPSRRPHRPTHRRDRGETNAIIDSALDGCCSSTRPTPWWPPAPRTTSGWWPLTPCWPGWKTTATGWWSSSPAIAPTWTNSWTPTRDFGRVSPATSTFLLHVP